jgi:phosphate starvation-inducible protein PhoH and related proteins
MSNKIIRGLKLSLSRKERRRLERDERKAGVQPPVPQEPTLKTIKPITINQNRVFKEFAQGKNLLIFGYAGTGKSFLACYLGLSMVNQECQKRVVIVRSAVPSRNQGFLPGTDAEKAAVFEPPYRAIVDDLYGRKGAYNRLKDTKVIEFVTTSYLRGTTIDDAIILIDEVQNMTDEEINTVMTRVGQNTRVIICGDFRQNDLKKGEISCMVKLVETISRMHSFASVELMANDIVRSGLVKEWILAREGF